MNFLAHPVRKNPQADSPQAINKFPRLTSWQMPEFYQGPRDKSKDKHCNGINAKVCLSYPAFIVILKRPVTKLKERTKIAILVSFMTAKLCPVPVLLSW